MSDTTALYDLQKIDVTWDKVKRRLLQIQKLLGEPEELQKARAKVEQTDAAFHEWHAKQKNAELESQSLAARIKETDDKLMGGSVHNPKELEALQASLESMQRHRATVDDQGVEAMLSAEELAAQLAEQKAELDEIESAWIAGQDELKVEGAKMKRNYLALKKKT
ncbi:MAG: hypothetical protein HC802_10570 [Caldilineaceae bacterium]|nr:hypothetical protein [Caldilineaceae bacterium]